MSEQKIIDVIKAKSSDALGITSSPSSTLDITIDIREDNKRDRALGQMVYVVIEEDGKNILVIGQIISIETKNRWHEDPSFKGVIKRHGKLPHLSGAADNRIATISVQACYELNDRDANGYILGTSPSTGEKVHKMDNDVMNAIMNSQKSYITYIGQVYATDVDLPFWFKHFGKTQKDSSELGAGDAFHIGVFGKTGSGKSVTAAYMLLGYVKNKTNMSILVLDPQSQFYLDKELLPGGVKVEDKVKEIGMKYEKYKLVEDVCLPEDRVEVIAELLKNNGFIEKAFGPFYTPEKIDVMSEAVIDYLAGRTEKDPSFSLANVDKRTLLMNMLTRFATPSNEEKQKVKKAGGEFSKYIIKVWAKGDKREELVDRIKCIINNFDNENALIAKWESALSLYSPKKSDATDKISFDALIDKIVKDKGNFIILDIGPRQGEIDNENLQALFVRILENKIVAAGADGYAHGRNANCLIVMDEAHRFISNNATDERIRTLTVDIIGSVRTTRKYGIGYMFTQTIESLDEEILRQMRIFAFGYGLTSGQEIRKVKEIINNDSALQLYKSFIDPSSNRRFPFMFFGPISPLSFTGSPLFLEVYSDVKKFK